MGRRRRARRDHRGGPGRASPAPAAGRRATRAPTRARPRSPRGGRGVRPRPQGRLRRASCAAKRHSGASARPTGGRRAGGGRSERARPRHVGSAGCQAHRQGLLPDDADLLRQRRPPHRARLHDDGGRRPHPLAPAARRAASGSSPASTSTARRCMRTAEANGVAPQEWADRLVESAWLPGARDDRRRQRRLHPHHLRPATPSACSAFLQGLHDTGYIYRARTRAPTASAARSSSSRATSLDGEGEYVGQKVCPIHGRPVELLSENNWFFRLSAFAERAARALRGATPTRCSRSRRTTRSSRSCAAACSDLSISRSTFDWGIPVPWDPSQVVYVWFDALLNYATAVGLGDEPGTPGRGAVRRDLAGRRAPRRQGHPAVPRRHLAGDAHGRRAAAAGQGLRARLAARRRREDEQDQAHRHRAEPDHRPLRLGRVPLLLPARDPVRVRTARSRGRT